MDILRVKNPNSIALIEEKDEIFKRIDLNHCLRIEGIFLCKRSFSMGPLTNSGNLTTSIQAGHFWETQTTQASWILEGQIGLLHSVTDLKIYEVCRQLQRKVEFSAGTQVFPRREDCTYFEENNQPLKLDDFDGRQIVYKAILVNQRNLGDENSGGSLTEYILNWTLTIVSFIIGLFICVSIAYIKLVLTRRMTRKNRAKEAKALPQRSPGHDDRNAMNDSSMRCQEN